MKCITLTLNPAFDKHCFVNKLVLGREHLADRDFINAGGKGLNISRALLANGTDADTVVVLGGENEEAFCAALDSDNLRYIAVPINGKIRENLTIHSADGSETRISFKGFEAEDVLLDKVYATIEKSLDFDTIFTFTGSVPVGISMNAVTSFIKRISDKGCRVVIDSKSFKTLEEIAALKVWLIKPNGEEFGEYIGRNVESHEEILEVAGKLQREGIENVMISLCEKGAMLVCKEGAYIATPPSVEVKSTIGAGDSSIAGFISAVMKGESIENALRTSVAYGTAACLCEGTLPPQPEDVERIYKTISITNIHP